MDDRRVHVQQSGCPMKRTWRFLAGSGKSESGAEIVEASFVFLLFLAVFWLLLDTGWVIFAKVTIQHAVREGVRYAITSQTVGGLGQVDSIKQRVQYASMGLLSSDDASKIQVEFRTADTQASAIGSPYPNQGGNIVVVSVVDYQIRPLFALLHTADPIQFTVRSADQMEASPVGGPPPL